MVMHNVEDLVPRYEIGLLQKKKWGVEDMKFPGVLKKK